MSSEVQALFMIGGGSEPPIQVCTGDPYYSCSEAARRTVLSIHADTNPPVDQSCYQTKTLVLTGSAAISNAQSQFGGNSLYVPNNGTSTVTGLVVSDHTDFDFGTSDFTIDLWAYRSANTYVGTLFYGTLGGGEFSVKVGTDGLIDLIYRSSGGSQSFSNVATWPIGEWVYFVVQRRGTSWETYINGVLVHSAAITGGASSTVNSTGDLLFGRPTAGGTQSWGGYIDDIRVTKGAARYDNPDVVSAAFPEGSADPYWDDVILLLHAEGTNGGEVFTDSSSAARAVTKHLGTPITSTEQAKFGSTSLKLYGNQTSIITNLDSSLYLSDNDFTIEFWLYYAVAVGSFNRRALQADTGSSPPWTVTCFSSTNAVDLTLRSGGTQFATVATGSLNIAEWYHIAFCRRNKTTLQAFVNGILVQTSAIVNTAVSNNASGIIVGNNLNNSDLAPRFYIDEVRITNGTARYPSTFAFVPPLITFCESVGDESVNPISGEETLSGITATVSQGSLSVSGGSLRLNSQSATVSGGNLVSVVDNAPFPDLKGTISDNFGTLRLDAPIVVWHDFKIDGTIWRTIFSNSSSPLSTTQVGTWIDITNPDYTISAITNQYTFSASATKGSTGNFSWTVPVMGGLDPDILIRTNCNLGFVSPCTFTVYISVLPAAINPRFGEAGHLTNFSSNFTLSQPLAEPPPPPPPAAHSVTIPDGDVSVTGNPGLFDLGVSRAVSVSGGTGPFTYAWSLAVQWATDADIWLGSSPATSSSTRFGGFLGSASGGAQALVTCTVTDTGNSNTQAAASIYVELSGLA